MRYIAFAAVEDVMKLFCLTYLTLISTVLIADEYHTKKLAQLLNSEDWSCPSIQQLHVASKNTVKDEYLAVCFYDVRCVHKVDSSLKKIFSLRALHPVITARIFQTAFLGILNEKVWLQTKQDYQRFCLRKKTLRSLAVLVSTHGLDLGQRLGKYQEPRKME